MIDVKYCIELKAGCSISKDEKTVSMICLDDTTTANG
jgi:hypothetical protein